jgi:hypothetical protein
MAMPKDESVHWVLERGPKSLAIIPNIGSYFRADVGAGSQWNDSTFFLPKLDSPDQVPDWRQHVN